MGEKEELKRLYFQLQNQKSINFAEYSQKTYFQTVYMIALGVFLLVSAFGGIKLLEYAELQREDVRNIIELIIAGIPFVIIAWFCSFLFIYWDHHMARNYLDYCDKQITEEIYNTSDTKKDIKLLYKDFLGVRNAHFSVVVLYFIIGCPVGLICILTGWRGFNYLRTIEDKNPLLEKFLGGLIHFEYRAWIYAIILIVSIIYSFYSHIVYVDKKRKLMEMIGKEGQPPY